MSALHYAIHLEPDPAQCRFDGRVEIHIADPLLVAGDRIVLDSRDLQVAACAIDGTPVPFVLDPECEQLSVGLPRPVGSGITLAVDYAGVIADDYAGLYRSRFDHDGQSKVLATTQFQADEARRVFPCFDRPAYRATFDFALLIDADLTAISNMPVAEESPRPDGKKLVRFQRTPPMATYLLFVGVGEFEFGEDDGEQPLVRVATTPGKREHGRFALQAGRQALRFGSEYTGIPYPLPKCDYIAVPDSMGAMENFGAIRHDESLLLVYPGVTTQAQQAQIAAIIAHETIHMWFGDLVGPLDWRYLWLNEAFATYFTAVIPDHFYPEWQVWNTFLGELMLEGLERDALRNTVAIEPPHDVAGRDAAPTPSTAPIIYPKGASVIRMLADHLGEEAFRCGLNTFLSRHRFEAVTAAQLWDAIGDVTGAPVQAFADSWIKQPGFPLLDLARDGDTLQVSQQRFSYLPLQSDCRWLIPLTLACYLPQGAVQAVSVLIDEATATVALPPGTVAYSANVDRAGFYRVRYRPEDVVQLGALARAQTLSANDTFALVNDLFALVRRGDVAAGEFLDFVEAFLAEEDRPLPLRDLLASLRRLYLVVPRLRDRVACVGTALAENVLDKVGWQPTVGEGLRLAQLRADLLLTAAQFGSASARAFGLARFEDLLAGRPLSTDILPTVLKIGAMAHDRASSYLLARLRDRSTAAGALPAILEALGYLPTEDLVWQALAVNLDLVAGAYRLPMIAAAAQNGRVVGGLWRWFTENLASLERLPSHRLQRAIVDLIPTAGLGHQDAVSAFFAAYAAERPETGDAVDMALELLAINARLRNAGRDKGPDSPDH